MPPHDLGTRELYLEAVRLMTKSPEQALGLLERILATDPGYYRAYARLGGCKLLLGDEEGALDAYRRCVTLAPEYAPGWRGLGHACWELRDLDGAAAAFRTLVEHQGGPSEDYRLMRAEEHMLLIIEEEMRVRSRR